MPAPHLLSDPVVIRVPAFSNLVVSIYLPDNVATSTFHSLGVQTTYVTSPGNFTAAVSPPVAEMPTSGFFLSGLSVQAGKRSAAIDTLATRSPTASPRRWTPTAAGPTCWRRGCRRGRSTTTWRWPTTASAATARCTT